MFLILDSPPPFFNLTSAPSPKERGKKVHERIGISPLFTINYSLFTKFTIPGFDQMKEAF
jgi:hypothetical protein